MMERTFQSGSSTFLRRWGKGIPKRVMETLRNHHDFLRLLREPSPDPVSFCAIRSQNHELRHVSITKSGLSVYNDKVFQVSSSFSQPHGHWRNQLVTPRPLLALADTD